MKRMITPRNIRIAAALLPLCLVTVDAASQNRAMQDQLQAAARVDCLFSAIGRTDWSDSAPSISTDESDLSAAFVDIDVESGTADAEGRFGASYIIVRYEQGYLHFMQSFSAGPIYLTTVLAHPTADGRFKAVHTRHEYTEVSLPNFTSRPEIYVGDCSVDVADDEDSAEDAADSGA
jgi:hypothetical protein